MMIIIILIISGRMRPSGPRAETLPYTQPLNIHMCVYTHICIYTYRYISYTYIYIYMCMCSCAYSLSLYMYIYIYIYIYMYVYIYIYIYVYMPCSRFIKRGCSGNRVWWFVWCYMLIRYIVLPQSTAPPSWVIPYEVNPCKENVR